MHIAVSRLALPVATVALLVGGLAVAGPAAADTSPQRPSQGPVSPDKVTSGAFTPLSPSRILDTRPASALAPSRAITVKVTGKGGVPSDGVAAVVLNLTAVTPTASGYLSAYPNPGKPTSSNLNFSTGRTIANLAVVPVAANGTVQLFNGSGGRLNVLADVTGWFGPANGTPTLDGAFAPTGPSRLLDTRSSRPVPAGGVVTVQVTGRVSIPAVAGAAFLNVTAVGAAGSGYLTAYPGGTRPNSSNLNFTSGQTVAGAAAVRLSPGGAVTIYNSSAKPLQVTVDIAGWFRGSTATKASLFSFLSPLRAFDTRSSIPTGPRGIAAGADRRFNAAGVAGVPGVDDVAAVVLSVTATRASASGYLTVFAGPDDRPTASTLNFSAGQSVPNLVVVPVNPLDGMITIHNGSAQPVDVLADVAGYVRRSDLDVPSTSTSRYVNDLRSADTTSQISTKMTQHGCDDVTAITDGDDHFSLLEFGAQSNKVPATGGGTTTGVLPPNTLGNSQRLTYAQVVTAVKAYIDGVNNCRTEDVTGAYTVGVGTNSDGFAGATYTPTAKGADWASKVVTPLVAYGNGFSVEVVGANDIEANFDASAAQVKTWVSSFLAGNTLELVNNGAAVQCPAALGQIGKSCEPVAIDTGGQQTWTQGDYVQFSHTIAPTRISVLPQIYSADDANRWENIALQASFTGAGPVRFAGVLTQFAACGASCSPTPAAGWALMRQALDFSGQTNYLTLPAVSDIDYDS